MSRYVVLILLFFLSLPALGLTPPVGRILPPECGELLATGPVALNLEMLRSETSRLLNAPVSLLESSALRAQKSSVPLAYLFSPAVTRRGALDIETGQFASKLYLVKIGRLTFIDAETYALFSESMKKAIAGITGQITIVPDLTDSELGSSGYREYTYSAIALMTQIEFGGAEVIDLGAGRGMLSLTALKLGAKKTSLFEIDPEMKSAAERLLASNHFKEEFDFNFQAVDLSDQTQRSAAFRRVKTKDNRPTIVLSNVGAYSPGVAWQGYTITNQTSISMIPEMGNVVGFLAGGYNLTKSGFEVIDQDINAAQHLGLGTERTDAVFSDPEEAMLSWYLSPI